MNMTTSKRKEFFKHVKDMEDFVKIDFDNDGRFDCQALKGFLSRFGMKGLRLGKEGLRFNCLGTIFALRYNRELDEEYVSDNNLIRCGIQMLSIMVDEPRKGWRYLPCECDWLAFPIICSMQECVKHELDILKYYGFID